MHQKWFLLAVAIPIVLLSVVYLALRDNKHKDDAIQTASSDVQVLRIPVRKRSGSKQVEHSFYSGVIDESGPAADTFPYSLPGFKPGEHIWSLIAPRKPT